jgi:exopolysaccharide biosynthesis protein
MAEDNNALVAMNASGVKTSVGRNPVTGTAILNGKIYYYRNIIITITHILSLEFKLKNELNKLWE